MDFAGTDLMPSATGEAKVDSKRGSIEIDAEFGKLQRTDDFRYRVPHLYSVGDFS